MMNIMLAMSIVLELNVVTNVTIKYYNIFSDIA